MENSESIDQQVLGTMEVIQSNNEIQLSFPLGDQDEKFDANSNNPVKSEKSDIKLDSTYLLCVDPSDKQTFIINMGTRQIVEDEKTAECQEAILSKIERSVYLIKELLDEICDEDARGVTPFTITPSKESEIYRRSMVRTFNLEQESQHFQRYIDKSDLSDNLTSTYKHSINVYIIEGIEQYDKRLNYMRQNSQRDGSSHCDQSHRGIAHTVVIRNRKKTLLKREIDKEGFFILKHISLLQTADQVIDVIQVRIEKEYLLQIDSNRYAFILKFRNSDSYLFGPEQLVYFQDIRDALKYKRPIEVVVMVIDKSAVEAHFPPLLNYAEDLKILEEERSSRLAMEKSAGTSQRMGPHQRSLSGGLYDYGQSGSNSDQMSNPHSIMTHALRSRQNSSFVADLQKKKEFLSKVGVDELMQMKYKKSSVFFWYKPSNKVRIPKVMP